MNLSILLMALIIGAGLPAGAPSGTQGTPQTPPPTTPPPTTPPPSTPPPTTPIPPKPDEDPEKIKVWATPSGKKYHKSTCRYAKSASAITLKEARAKGLTACKVCGGY